MPTGGMKLWYQQSKNFLACLIAVTVRSGTEVRFRCRHHLKFNPWCFEQFWQQYFILKKLQIIWVFRVIINWVVHILREDVLKFVWEMSKYAWSNWKFLKKFQKKRFVFVLSLLRVYNDRSTSMCCAHNQMDSQVLSFGWSVPKNLEVSWFYLPYFVYTAPMFKNLQDALM